MRPIPGSPVAPPPARYVLPTISGNPAAVFRLAGDYRELADAVAAAQRRVGHVIEELAASWRGAGHRALTRPAEVFSHHTTLLTRALRQAADDLETYGHQLARAQHHHGISLHKILVVGAVTAVSATAIVVTVGAAGVVEAGVAAAAVGGATEAAGSAAAADLVAAGAVDEALGGLSGLQPLLSFVLPHLVQAEWAAGLMAAYDETTTGRLRWHAIAETAGTAFLASGAAAKGTAAIGGDSPWLPHVIQGTAWSGAAAADDELIKGEVSLTDVAESFVLAGGSTLARDSLREHGLWLSPPDYRRAALVALSQKSGRIADREIAHELALLRQPADELRHGLIDLRLNEGPGHTIDRHVSKSAGDLLTRVRSSQVRVASTYWDEAGARSAIAETLRVHDGDIAHWVGAGCPKTLRLHLRVPYDLGFAVDRSGTVRFVRQATVILRRDSAGIVVVTSYPR